MPQPHSPPSNQLIHGDNLKVLKALQTSHLEQVHALSSTRRSRASTSAHRSPSLKQLSTVPLARRAAAQASGVAFPHCDDRLIVAR